MKGDIPMKTFERSDILENVKYDIYSLENKEFREATVHRRTAITLLYFNFVMNLPLTQLFAESLNLWRIILKFYRVASSFLNQQTNKQKAI
jgi:hypothetical protein